MVGNIEQQLTVKIDSKGRICIPAELREVLGDTATIKKTPEGILLIPGQTRGFPRRIQKIGYFRTEAQRQT